MKKLICIATIIAMIAAVMIPMCASANALGPGAVKYVNCSNGKNLNVREQPNTDSRVMYTLRCGTKVEILGFAGNGWAKVSPANGGQTGYVMTKFLQDNKPGKYEITERQSSFRTVQPFMAAAKALNDRTDRSVGLRVEPNKNSSAIRRLSAGDQVEVIATGRNWDEVIDPVTGQTGYVASSYLELI